MSCTTVCGKWLSTKMFANPEKTILMPKAIPSLVRTINYSELEIISSICKWLLLKTYRDKYTCDAC